MNCIQWIFSIIIFYFQRISKWIFSIIILFFQQISKWIYKKNVKTEYEIKVEADKILQEWVVDTYAKNKKLYKIPERAKNNKYHKILNELKKKYEIKH